MIIQRLCSSGRIINSTLRYRIIKLNNNANFHNFSSIKNNATFKSKVSNFIPRRNFYRLFKRPTKEELKVKDDVPDQYVLIYRSTMDRYIFLSQIITNISALIVTIIVIVKHDFKNIQIDFSEWKTPPQNTENEYFIYVAAFIAIVVVLQVLISRLPVRIYNLPQQKKYIFVFYGNYPFTQRKLLCKVGDVAPMPESKNIPWSQDRYIIKNEQKIILLENYFRRPADLYIMMGVQRDPDVDNSED